MPKAFGIKLVEAVLANESDGDRFERFFCAFLTEALGVPMLTTLSNYDNGKDGRDGVRNDSYPITTVRDSQDKLLGDVDKLKSKHSGTISAIYLGVAKAMTEAALDPVRNHVHKKFHANVNVAYWTGPNIAESIGYGRGADAFQKYYGAEYDRLKDALSAPAMGEDAGIRLALGTIVDGNAVDLRLGLADSLILDLLSDGTSKTAAEMRAEAEKKYKLPRFSEVAIQFYCGRAVDSELAVRDGSKWKISAKGIAAQEKIVAAEKDRVVLCSVSIKNQLEALLGKPIEEKQWVGIWRELTKGISSILHVHGLEFILSIEAFVNRKERAISRESIWEQLHAAIKKSVTQFTKFKAEEVEEALIHVFSPNNDETGEWLYSIASSYVMLCSLGFDPKVAEAAKEALAELTFVFDTDVVLAALCAHEPGHHSAASIKKCVSTSGAQVLVPYSVAEEGARHAARARADHAWGIESEAPAVTTAEIERTQQTVFGREYELLKYEGRPFPGGWEAFINIYAGKARTSENPDVPNLVRLLKKDGFQVLAPLGDGESRKARELHQKILAAVDKGRPSGKPLSMEETDKLRIDAELLVQIDSINAAGKTTPVLVTSSGKFRWYDKVIAAEVEALHMLRPEAVVWMLSLLPDTYITREQLGAFIFEGRQNLALVGLEKQIYSVLSKSQSLRAPVSQRSILAQSLYQRMLGEAKKYGGKVEGLIKKPNQFLELLTSAIDAEPALGRRTLDLTDKQAVLESLKREIEKMPN